MAETARNSSGTTASPSDAGPGGSGIVFDIQRYAVHDGPGIRTTVFLKGCPLDCWWCHNPESQSAQPQIVVMEGRCVRCGECVKVCPQGEAGAAAADRPRCTACGACVAACPAGARRMAGARMTVEEVLAEVLKDRLFYEESGGGATFSGGEPLFQPQFLHGLLQACRSAGLPTAVDTCGFAPWDDLRAVVPLTDLFLYDLKGADEQSHAHHTGVPSGPILDNLRALGAVHDNIWIRIPVLPGINDDDAQVDAMARLAASAGGVRRVNLLPYHKTGVHKFRQLGRAYRLERLAPPSPERMEDVAARFRAFGLRVRVGG
ncbi:MAG: glycyl-radical enzyme activating protein [Planctomycetes bacterium]|nr:glycyl-radical enzyme activating protein [Planctomycetota bacterium]